MKIRTACLDRDLLWVIDDVIGGLYTINQKTMKTKCVIDCQNLFPYGKFEVISLFIWKENYVVIIPREINRRWIFYNKVTREIEYRKIIEKKCQEILLAVDNKRSQLYFFPIYTYDPILIVDLNTLICSQMIEKWSNKVSNDYCKTSWKGIYNGHYTFFVIINTKILVRMDCKIQRIDLLKLDISEMLVDIGYGFGELWILPVNGNQLYQIDENGIVFQIVKLSVKNDLGLLPNFVRIVVQKRYLFLLPYYQKGIYVYDKLKGEVHIIPEKKPVLEKKNKAIPLRYWEYYIRDNWICFLPFEDNYIEIDLNSLEYKNKEIFYPNIWSNEEKIKNCIWNHNIDQDFIIREVEECNLSIFLKYVCYRTYIDDFFNSKYIGRKIWNMIKS